MDVLPYAKSPIRCMIRVQILTRTNDTRFRQRQAREGVVGRKAVYKGRTERDTTSYRRHACRDLGRCEENQLVGHL